MIRTALRGLRGRLLLSLVATSAVTLVVAAAITIGPLQSRLRDQSETALQETTSSREAGGAAAKDSDRLLRPEPTRGVGRRVVNGGHGVHLAQIPRVSRVLLKAANRP
jgi:hypothetical protein